MKTKTDEIYNKIVTKSYIDLSDNYATYSDVQKYKNLCQSNFHIEMDDEYLDFLILLNGFELNGFNFYGTFEQKRYFILNGYEQNIFWRSEIPELSDYYLIADGDMDFYCFNPEEKNYVVLTKSTTRLVEKYKSFTDLLKKVVEIYC